MRVALTGTPGTGKTAVGTSLQRQGYTVVQLHRLAQQNSCIDGIDTEGVSELVDVVKLDSAVKRNYSNDVLVFFEGHLGHLLKAMDKVIVLVERLAGRTAAGRATPRDLRALGDSLTRLPAVLAAVRRTTMAGALAPIAAAWDDAAELAAEITATLVPRPPLAFGDGETIAPGVDAALDELRAIATGGKDAIAALQAEERARTGISSLKVGYNRVFGYYIEITNANKHLVPTDYQRRQNSRAPSAT